MKIKLIVLFSWTLFYSHLLVGQDSGLLILKGDLPATFYNTALPLEKGWHISAGNTFGSFATNGPAFNDIFKKNSQGERYMDIRSYTSDFPERTTLTMAGGLRSLDIAYAWNSWSLMAGHGLRTEGSFHYPRALAELGTFGNGPFIGREVNLGISSYLNSYNELSIGFQKRMGNLNIGVRGKLLYGISSVKTDDATALFKTDDAYYAWTLNNNYTVRSSGLLRYYQLDSIGVNFNPLTFENLFYNNRGWGLDVGFSLDLNDKTTISAGIQDLGKITWDFFPRKYQSIGTFTFDGLDIFSSLGDTTGIQINDTLLNIIKVNSDIEKFSTSLNHIFNVSGIFKIGKTWSLIGSYTAKNHIEVMNHQFSLSVTKNYRFLNLGASVNYSSFGYVNAGFFTCLKYKAFSIYGTLDNPMFLFKPFDSTNTFFRIGTTLKF